MSANNPESGTITYSYDNNGNLTIKTDAREIETTYTYDALNRVIYREYSDSTPQVTYTYDDKTNAKGKLTKVTTGNPLSPLYVTEYQVFDTVGRVTQSQQFVDGEDYGDPMTYTYNLSGALIEQKYPSGRVVKNVLDNDGDLAIVQSKKNANYGYWNYANSFTYTAAGAVSSMQLGNGRWESTQFNSRLQPTQIALGVVQNATDLLKLDFSYGTTQNNGNVQSQTITVPTIGSTNGFTATQTYTYDSLNRLKSAEETISSQQTWKQTFLYDRYGNRNFDEANTTTLPKNCLDNAVPVVCSADRKVVNPEIQTSDNRLKTDQDSDQQNDYLFDTSGNTTKDAQGRTFIYDAENKQIEVKDSQNQTIGKYFYDGDGKRVKKYVPATGETTILIYDAGGKLVAEYSTVVASQQDAKVSYLTADHLGSPRINTDANGLVTARHDYQPFGEEIQRASYGADTVRKQFTGYERDKESDLDFAQARMFGSSLGRFTSPDPLQASAQTNDPQTWNRYSYALNNPLKYIDPTGEKAKVVIETDEKNKTATIKITASIALWTSNKTSVTQGQLDQAAKNMEAAIEKGWSGTFVKDGITYTVQTDVDVQGYFGHDKDAAMKSGLDNVIEMTDGPPDGGPSHVEPRGILSSESAPDTGRWNVHEALNNTIEPAHEFGHLLGIDDTENGKHLMATDTNMVSPMTSDDFSRAFGSEIDGHREASRQKINIAGYRKKSVGPPRSHKSERIYTMWKIYPSR